MRERIASQPLFPFVLLLTTILAVDIGKDVLAYAAEGIPITLGAFSEQAIWWSLWVALLPLVLWVTRVADPDRMGWAGTAAAQLVAGVLVVTLHIGLAAAAFATSPPVPFGAEWARRFAGLTDRYFVSDFSVYAASVVTYLVWRYHVRLRSLDRAAAGAEVRSARLETLMRDARLDALRKELDPHFMHNALQSISGLVRAGENGRAVRMIAALGSHLRVLGSRDSADRVTIREEVELLGRYVEIEALRFGDRLDVAFDVDPASEELEVPALILQPLVENAIRHGVARIAAPVEVRVRSVVSDGALVLTVSDDGPGPKSGRGRGVGLANTRERLRHTFDDRATLGLEAGAGGDRPGAVATIRIELDAFRAPRLAAVAGAAS